MGFSGTYSNYRGRGTAGHGHGCSRTSRGNLFIRNTVDQQFEILKTFTGAGELVQHHQDAKTTGDCKNSADYFSPSFPCATEPS